MTAFAAMRLPRPIAASAPISRRINQRANIRTRRPRPQRTWIEGAQRQSKPAIGNLGDEPSRARRHPRGECRHNEASPRLGRRQLCQVFPVVEKRYVVRTRVRQWLHVTHDFGPVRSLGKLGAYRLGKLGQRKRTSPVKKTTMLHTPSEQTKLRTQKTTNRDGSKARSPPIKTPDTKHWNSPTSWAKKRAAGIPSDKRSAIVASSSA